MKNAFKWFRAAVLCGLAIGVWAYKPAAADACLNCHASCGPNEPCIFSCITAPAPGYYMCVPYTQGCWTSGTCLV